MSEVERIMTRQQSGTVTAIFSDGSIKRLSSLADTIPLLLLRENALVDVSGGDGGRNGELASLVCGLIEPCRERL